ncbi:hypothetical protein WS91_17145 [Burkholderia sp. MSMB1498]|nr:hypothetical protein WS91_17145 [Burkholderia sp. MSMB1498]
MRALRQCDDAIWRRSPCRAISPSNGANLRGLFDPHRARKRVFDRHRHAEHETHALTPAVSSAKPRRTGIGIGCGFGFGFGFGMRDAR